MSDESAATAERLPEDESTETREMIGRLTEAVVDALHPLTGTEVGRIAAFRFVAVVSKGDDTYRTIALDGLADDLEPLQSAFDQMLDFIESRRRDVPPTGSFYRDDVN